MSQKPPRWMMSGLSKHMVFTIENQRLAIWDGLWEHIFSTLVSGQCSFVLFTTFEILVPKRCPKWTSNPRKNGSCFDNFPQSGPTGLQGWSRPPKRHQNGAPGHQNGPQVIPNSSFVVENERNKPYQNRTIMLQSSKEHV